MLRERDQLGCDLRETGKLLSKGHSTLPYGRTNFSSGAPTRHQPRDASTRWHRTPRMSCSCYRTKKSCAWTWSAWSGGLHRAGLHCCRW